MKLTNDYMDDLVDAWHEAKTTMPLTMFLAIYTGLSYEQIVHWIETAELPEEE